MKYIHEIHKAHGKREIKKRKNYLHKQFSLGFLGTPKGQS